MTHVCMVGLKGRQWAFEARCRSFNEQVTASRTRPEVAMVLVQLCAGSNPRRSRPQPWDGDAVGRRVLVDAQNLLHFLRERERRDERGAEAAPPPVPGNPIPVKTASAAASVWVHSITPDPVRQHSQTGNGVKGQGHFRVRVRVSIEPEAEVLG